MEICDGDKDSASDQYVLPDIMPSILSKLPLRNIIKFKSVSRGWRDLIQSRFFALLHLSDVPSLYHSYLVVSTNSTNHIFEASDDDDDGSNIFPAKIGTFTFSTAHDSTDVHSSVDGLILMRQHHLYCKNLVICNPITREFVRLPPHQGSRESCLGFGVTRKSNEYKVVMISESRCQVYTLGTGEWRRISGVRVGAVQAPTPPPHECAHVGGNFYFLDPITRTEVHCFDLETEALASSFPAPPPRYTPRFHRSLCVLKGCLCMCDAYDKNSKGVEIHMWLMRGDGDWRKEYVIRDDMRMQHHVLGKVYPIKVTRDGGVLLSDGGMTKVLYYSSKKNGRSSSSRRLYPNYVNPSRNYRCDGYVYGRSTAIVYRPTFLSLKDLLMGKGELVQSF